MLFPSDGETNREIAVQEGMLRMGFGSQPSPLMWLGSDWKFSACR